MEAGEKLSLENWNDSSHSNNSLHLLILVLLHLNPLKFGSMGILLTRLLKFKVFFSSKHPLYFVACCLSFIPYISLCFCNIIYLPFPLGLVPLLFSHWFLHNLLPLNVGTSHSLLSPLFFLFHFLFFADIISFVGIVSYMQISIFSLIKLLSSFAYSTLLEFCSRNKHPEKLPIIN